LKTPRHAPSQPSGQYWGAGGLPRTRPVLQNMQPVRLWVDITTLGHSNAGAMKG
jgi:hypothetical protein